MPRKISAGAILTDGTKFLVCHATGQIIWDLPKGGVDPEENFLEACLREIREETGFVVPEDAYIEDLGRYPYLPAKDLYLFRITLKEPPHIDTLKCTSMVELPDRDPFPEVNAFLYVTPKSAIGFVSNNLRRTLVLAGIIPDEFVP
jgi:8-oxo-dGTP pyrophosphatase MutT (NUDIX family)